MKGKNKKVYPAFVAYVTRNGKRYYARDYGKKAWPIGGCSNNTQDGIKCIKINRQRKSASGGFCTIPLFPYHSGCHADDKKIM